MTSYHTISIAIVRPLAVYRKKKDRQPNKCAQWNATRTVENSDDVVQYMTDETVNSCGLDVQLRRL